MAQREAAGVDRGVARELLDLGDRAREVRHQGRLRVEAGVGQVFRGNTPARPVRKVVVHAHVRGLREAVQLHGR